MQPYCAFDLFIFSCDVFLFKAAEYALISNLELDEQLSLTNISECSWQGQLMVKY